MKLDLDLFSIAKSIYKHHPKYIHSFFFQELDHDIVNNLLR